MGIFMILEITTAAKNKQSNEVQKNFAIKIDQTKDFVP